MEDKDLKTAQPEEPKQNTLTKETLLRCGF